MRFSFEHRVQLDGFRLTPSKRKNLFFLKRKCLIKLKLSHINIFMSSDALNFQKLLREWGLFFFISGFSNYPNSTSKTETCSLDRPKFKFFRDDELKPISSSVLWLCRWSAISPPGCQVWVCRYPRP